MSDKLRVLRVTDQESARVVAVKDANDTIRGAGCLIDERTILTCRHVLQDCLGHKDVRKDEVLRVTLTGFSGAPPTVDARVVEVEEREGFENDLALLQIVPGQQQLKVPAVEFASPMRHLGKRYSVIGFPLGNPQGLSAYGTLHAADAKGLVQMDRLGAISVQGGFSGAPVWSPDLAAFIGIVVSELKPNAISWCIPSRRLCEFYGQLPVRFRIPPMDRPIIHDREDDDPNRILFGEVDDDGQRRLRASVHGTKGDYTVRARYECVEGKARGKFVTFITYPDFDDEDEDSYELFAEVNEQGVAEQVFYPVELFTMAAIGDAGDTALTLDLATVSRKKKRRKQ